MSATPASGRSRGAGLVLLGLCALLTVLTAVFGRNGLLPGRGEPPPLPVHTVATVPTRGASLVVRTRDGGKRNLGGSSAKLLIVHFWATWCLPCVEELPGLLAYSRSIKTDPTVELVAVSVDDDFRTVDSWLRKRRAEDLPIALDPHREAATAMGTLKFPETYFLSPAGEVLLRVEGPLDWSSKETRARIDSFRGVNRSGAAL